MSYYLNTKSSLVQKKIFKKKAGILQENFSFSIHQCIKTVAICQASNLLKHQEFRQLQRRISLKIIFSVLIFYCGSRTRETSFINYCNRNLISSALIHINIQGKVIKSHDMNAVSLIVFQKRHFLFLFLAILSSHTYTVQVIH